MYTNVKEHKISSMILVLAFEVFCIGCIFSSVSILPIANLAKEFGIPAVAATALINVIEGGGTAATIISIIAGLATGGLGLIAAGAKQGVKAFLKAQLKKLGKKAFIAW